MWRITLQCCMGFYKKLGHLPSSAVLLQRPHFVLGFSLHSLSLGSCLLVTFPLLPTSKPIIHSFLPTFLTDNLATDLLSAEDLPWTVTSITDLFSLQMSSKALVLHPSCYVISPSGHYFQKQVSLLYKHNIQPCADIQFVQILASCVLFKYALFFYFSQKTVFFKIMSLVTL